MHEATLIQNMLQIATQQLQPYNVEKVNSLTICMGIFSGALKPALYAAFDAAKAEIYTNTKLIIKQLDAEVCCTKCGNRQLISAFPYSCSHCGNDAMELLSGQELYLESIDFDERGE